MPMPLSFHIIGDAFVDLFSFLDGDWPEQGGDARLDQPVTAYAGGSSTNTTTHLKTLLLRQHGGSLGEISIHENVDDEPSPPEVVLHTVLNPNDHYGQLLLQHAEKHGFPIVNCRDEDDGSWTGHCIVVVSRGERSFMTHQGCVGNFVASDLDYDRMIEADGPVHIHVAGYYNLNGFWDGKFQEQIARVRNARKAKFPHQTTTVSLVTQHDASQQWDGGLDQLIPYLDFLIVNEPEANKIYGRGTGSEPNPNGDPIDEWVSFFSPLNPEAYFIITRGPQGAVCFRNGVVIGAVRPAVPVPVVDPTGAGDAFAAGFMSNIWAWRRKSGEWNSNVWSENAVRYGLEWGCASGSATTTIRGASVPPDTDDIVKLYEKQKARKLLSGESL